MKTVGGYRLGREEERAREEECNGCKEGKKGSIKSVIVMCITKQTVMMKNETGTERKRIKNMRRKEKKWETLKIRNRAGIRKNNKNNKREKGKIKIK